ncbi:MAG: sigma-70 family RNA polymerase sigma factor [Verrucomicrobiota bacterium]|jgi:RNA polymerase sigma factor (sigma-70 family)
MPIPRSDPLPTRPTLLAKLKDWQDQESWQRFYETYRRLIFNAACKSGLTESEAEEAVQETVLSVARTMPDFKYDPSKCSFKTWLMHLTRKRIIDIYRKRPPVLTRKSSRQTGQSDTPTVERVPDPETPVLQQVWDEEWQRNLSEAAIQKVRQQVSSRQFQVFDLYVNKGWSVREVATTLHVNVGQVYLAKHRILSLIKKETRKLEQQLI